MQERSSTGMRAQICGEMPLYLQDTVCSYTGGGLRGELFEALHHQLQEGGCERDLPALLQPPGERLLRAR